MIKFLVEFGIACVIDGFDYVLAIGIVTEPSWSGGPGNGARVQAPQDGTTKMKRGNQTGVYVRVKELI